MSLCKDLFIVLEGFGSRKNIGLPQGKIKRTEKKMEIEGIQYHSRPSYYCGNINGHKIKIKGPNIDKEIFVNLLTHEDAIAKAHERGKKGKI